MADQTTILSIGGTGTLASGTVTLDTTTNTVASANLSAAIGLLGAAVPVLLPSGTIDGSGNVTITGTALTVDGVVDTFILNFKEGAASATVTLKSPLGPTQTATVTVTVVCFCSGTLIRTTAGDVAVEDLAIGDTVVTASGRERAIRWIGRRDYAGRFLNANPDLLPVRIAAHAIADNVPARDLLVSPKHALYLNGALIPAAALVNGRTVTKEASAESLTYWHVELDSHDVLLAENVPAESFVNDEGRMIFQNAASFAERYPDAPAEEAVYCAPRVESGYLVEAVRRGINARADMATRAALAA